VAQIRCFKQDAQIGVATGFFYTLADRLYFITNRHVVINEDDDHFPDELRLRLHINPNDIRQNADYSVSLYDDKDKPLWLEHPIGRSEIDVVAIPLNKDQVTSRFFVKAFSASDHIPPNVDVSIGEDVLVLGYPLGFYDCLHNLPIVRNTVMASVYPVPFEGKPIILIDSRLHAGTSGSPVLTKATNLIRYTDGSTAIVNRAASFLVGVHSATLDVRGRDPNSDEPLGLNLVWFASLIPEIIKQGSG